MRMRITVWVGILAAIGVNLTPVLPASAWESNMSLAESDASFVGEQGSNDSGSSVAIVGDLNGDGYEDMLVGAYKNSTGGEHAGKVYLFFGQEEGWSIGTSLALANASFHGTSDWDYVGAAVTGVGDVNADGYDDILIGSPNNDEPGGNPDICCDGAGVTYLVLGRASGWAADVPITYADASFWGEAAGDYSGAMVANAGDINGDGFDDLLITAYGNDEAEIGAGQAYLIYGRESGWMIGMLLFDADASFLGEHGGDEVHYAASAGDVNGDGFDDFLIGAPGNTEGGYGVAHGQVYLLLGAAFGWTSSTSLADSSASFISELACGGGDLCTGAGPVSGAGDVNGDGFDDIIVGGPGNNDNGIDAGKAYLVLGRNSGWAMDTSLADADAVLVGELSGDQFGTSVRGCGDANGDGLDDVLVNAAMSDESGIEAGETYLFFGGANLMGDVPGFSASFLGEGAGDRSGRAISMGGDLNSDGFDDILVGVPMNDAAGESAGQTYLILGHECADEDEDGWSVCEGDCDDANASVNPIAEEICNEGVDDDCDPNTNEDTDFDGDGFSVCDGDCDESDFSINPGEDEDCVDGIDNDCDGSIDLEDVECASSDDDDDDDDDVGDDDDTDGSGSSCECSSNPFRSGRASATVPLGCLLCFWNRRRIAKVQRDVRHSSH